MSSFSVLSAPAYSLAIDLQPHQAQVAEVVRRLDARLTEEQARLEKLTTLRAKGYASWQECAEQQVVVDRCAAQKRAVEQFATFLSAVVDRRPPTPREETLVASKAVIKASLLESTRRLAAAETEAGGALRMAEIAERRAQLMLDSLQQLQARGFATVREVQSARDELAAVTRHVEKLKARQSPQLDSATKDEHLEASALPVEFFHDASAVEHLLSLRLERCIEEARADSVAARLRMLEEINRRLDKASQSDAIRREREFAALDIEYSRAEAQHAKERMAILEREELRFVEQAVQPSQVATIVLTSNGTDDLQLGTYWESPASADAVHPGEAPYFLYEPLANRLSRITANEYNPASLRIWPSLQRPSNQPAFATANTPPLPFYPNIRATYYAFDRPPLPPSPYRVPSYGDYYQFGNLRPDLPKLEPRATSYGGPWFYPGASTNFR